MAYRAAVLLLSKTTLEDSNHGVKLSNTFQLNVVFISCALFFFVLISFSFDSRVLGALADFAQDIHTIFKDTEFRLQAPHNDRTRVENWTLQLKAAFWPNHGEAKDDDSV